jgi:diguanylate cyclase (GGDEF)-like protein
MRNEAYTDSLTHVRNKRAFDITLDGLTKRIDKDDRRFGLLMLDVNNLKHVNDLYGHAVGDRYLNNCCHLICEIFSHCPVFRIGGDEFVVLLENKDYDHYHERIDDLNNHMEDSLQEELPENRLSIAKGASFCMPTDKNPTDIFRRADRMMYIDKEYMKKHEPNVYAR